MKKEIVEAVEEARESGLAVRRALEILMLARSRYYDWIRGKNTGEVSAEELDDRKSTPGARPRR